MYFYGELLKEQSFAKFCRTFKTWTLSFYQFVLNFKFYQAKMSSLFIKRLIDYGLKFYKFEKLLQYFVR